MKLDKVVSSNISHVGYNSKKQVLHILFTNQIMYEYHAVSPEIYKEMMEAPSLGSYFSKNIARKFTYFKVLPENLICQGCHAFFIGENESECAKFQKNIENGIRLNECDEPVFTPKGTNAKSCLTCGKLNLSGDNACPCLKECVLESKEGTSFRYWIPAFDHSDHLNSKES